MECFLQFSLVGQMSKFAKVCLLIGHLLAFNPKHVGIFLKSLISYHSPTREATRTFPDNNRWVVRNFSCPEQRQRCFVIKVFLEISENPPHKENTCARVFFLIKLQAWDHSVNLFTYKIYLRISKNSFFDETPLGTLLVLIEHFWAVRALQIRAQVLESSAIEIKLHANITTCFFQNQR